MPVISVILAVFNSERFIEESIQSVLTQSYSDFELIIINDASTDGTPEIINQIRDSRIILVTNEKNHGLAKNFNKGLDLAKGNFIARMDADDICHRDRFKKQISFFNKNPGVDVCGTWIQFFGHQNRVLRNPLKHEDIKADLFFINNIIHPSVMFRREKFLENNLRYDENLVILEDYNLWIKAIECKLIFANIPKVLLKYRLLGDNFSLVREGNKKKIDDEHFKIYERFYSVLNLDYNPLDLKIHRELGLRNTDRVDKVQLYFCLTFLKKVVIANRSSHFICLRSFRTVIISCFSLLMQKSSIRLYPQIFSALLHLYSLKDLSSFINYKIAIRMKGVNRFN